MTPFTVLFVAGRWRLHPRPRTTSTSATLRGPHRSRSPPQDHRGRSDAQSSEHRHRDVHRGTARAAIFGVSDGLTTNVSLVLGVAAANTGASFVRLAGLAGLLAGSFSMATGEYVSMRAQTELFDRELKVEAEAISAEPDLEQRELAELYRAHGLRPDLADEVATQLIRDPEQALASHAREELGIREDHLGSPVGAALSSSWRSRSAPPSR